MNELNPRRPVSAILLAAGRGKRLQPYTDTVPKPLLAIHRDGRNRATLDLIFESLAAGGVQEIVIVAHHLADSIQTFLDASTWPLDTRMVRQKTLNGAAAAVSTGWAALSPTALSAPVIVTATDYLVTHDFYPQLLDFHQQHNADISVSLKRVPAEELSARSSVRIDTDGTLHEIVEKPAPGTAPSDLCANLLYIVPPTSGSAFAAVTASTRGECEAADAINALISAGASARALLQPTPSEWHPQHPQAISDGTKHFSGD